jgi:hypothetical protein
MESSSQNISIFILLLDHDNIPYEQVSLDQIIRSWLDSFCNRLPDSGIISMKVRAYGGWYEEDYSSAARYHASEFYQNMCPSSFFYGKYICRLSFEFADYLALPFGNDERADSAIRITHTVARRASAPNIKMLSQVTPCLEEGCQLRTVRTWVRRKRACTKQGCPHSFSNYFQRLEQKQVDVHMAVDLLTYVAKEQEGCHVAIASDDQDLLPAVAASAKHRLNPGTLTLIRLYSSATYLDSLLIESGVRIIRVPPKEGRSPINEGMG